MALPFLIQLVGSGIGGIVLSKLKDKAMNNGATGGAMSYTFTHEHQIIQSRIDRILGSGFAGSISPFVFGKETWTYPQPAPPNADILMPDGTRNLRFLITNYTNNDWEGSDKSQKTFDWLIHQIGHSTDFNNSIPARGGIVSICKLNPGWKTDDAIHYDNADQAMQGLYSIASDNSQFGGQGTTNSNDTYKAYSYPSPSVAAQYGNNLPYFIKCAPENIGCQLFQVNISTGTALMVLGAALVGVAAAIFAPEALPILLPYIQKIAGKITNAKTINNVASAKQFVTDMVKIKNGASINVQNGTTADMQQQASDYVDNNPQLFDSVDSTETTG